MVGCYFNQLLPLVFYLNPKPPEQNDLTQFGPVILPNYFHTRQTHCLQKVRHSQLLFPLLSSSYPTKPPVPSKNN